MDGEKGIISPSLLKRVSLHAKELIKVPELTVVKSAALNSRVREIDR